MKKSTGVKRAMLLSCAVILLCFTVITGMTWALFTDTERVNTHLQAGTLDITLLRTQLVKTTLNQKGYLEETEVQKATDPAVNFTQSTKENLFGITGGEVIVPGTKYVATLRVENHSDVAFGFWVRIAAADLTKGEDLAKQIKVTVDKGASSSATVANGLVVKAADGGCIGEVAVGEFDTFTVTVEFMDSYLDNNGLESGDNDLAQNESLSFDLIVHAVQATSPKS